jgi:hypothetical protein
MPAQTDNSRPDTTGEPCQIVAVALTDSERIEYQKAAERCGLSLAQWIRNRLRLAAEREAKEA